MGKDLLKNLFDEYKEAMASAKKPFLLYEIENANENAHTRLLERLLTITNKCGRYPLLESFIEQINLPSMSKESQQPIVTTQKKAIGPKNTGFIDLYIQYEDDQNHTIKVIVENKVKKAGDCSHQLARYVATIADIDKKSFDEGINNINWNELPSNIYLIYLTYSSNEEPSEDSLPLSLKDALGDRYISINYQDHILPWLEGELPTIPIGVDGTLASGMHQYIAYLKWYCENTNDWQPKGGWNLIDPHKSDEENYQHIGVMLKGIKWDKEESSQNVSRFTKFVEQVRESIFSNDCEGRANNEWAIHFTPSFMCLYKKSWANADERKYSIPSIYFIISYNDFTKAKELKWHLNVDHITPNDEKRSASSRFPDLMFQALSKNHTFNLSNHDKTANLAQEDVQETQSAPLGSMKKEDRAKYYENLLASSAATQLINEIDGLIPVR